MKNPYYTQKLYLARVDYNDQIIGQVERWKAHQESILHRGFTAILTYQNKFLIQHRKHLAFDKTWDLTFSSHQIFQNSKLQSDIQAIASTLKREWNLGENDLYESPQMLGKVYYKQKDKNSKFSEHEIDYIYIAKIKTLPKPNLDYSYSFELIESIDQIKKLPPSYIIAPWVSKILEIIKIPAI